MAVINMNKAKHIPKISLGPVLYYWDRETMFSFYERIAKSSVDIVYLGETVCSKRKLLRKNDWLSIAEMLQDAGKEVVLSGMTLIESNSDLASLKTLCSNNDFVIEANDMAAVQLLKGQPFITGPAINIYNPNSLKVLSKQGLKRWVMSVELSRDALSDMQENRPANIETEVFVYGRLPLAYSARCFTARAHNLPKDDCQYRCLDYPDGLMLATQEKEKFLVLNGIQTQSAKTCNLILAIPELIEKNVDVLRISPSSVNSEKMIEIFHRCVHKVINVEQASHEIEDLLPAAGACNGYWYGENGMDYKETGSHEGVL